MPTQPTSSASSFYSSSRTPNKRYQASSPPPPIEEEFRRIIEINKCKADPVYFISNYLYIFETRKEFQEGFKLFKLWPRQIEYVRFLELAFNSGWKEVTCEKPRDMGVSLLTEAWIVTKWLFTNDFSAIMATLTEDLIKLMPGHDTLFAKLRDYLEQLNEHTPWMMPKGFDFARHLTSMNLFNSENGNTVRGMLGTERFGRSARSSVLWRDESAFWDNDTSENTTQTAQLNIDTSSVNGLGFFNDMCDAAASYNPPRNFTFEWWHAENHTQKWFDDELDRATRKGMKALAKFKREILKDKHAIEEGQIYPNIARCKRPKPDEKDYEYNPDWTLYCFWDYGWTDMGYVGFLQRDPSTGDLYLIDEVYNSQVSIEWYVSFIPGKVVTAAPYHYEPQDLEKIIERRNWTGEVKHFGDPTGNQKQAGTGKSTFDILAPYGIKPRCKSGWHNMGLRQEKASLALLRLHIARRCEYFYNSFTQFRVPKRAENTQATNPQTKGLHKWSHAPSAFEAFAISEPPLNDDMDYPVILKEDRYQVAS